MTEYQAKQIANLLNARNQLQTEYTTNSILASEHQYVFLEDRSIVVSCAEFRRVQWYQFEIRRLSVQEKFERRGFGQRVLQLAEKKIRDKGGKVVQCTIQSDDLPSTALFLKSSYTKTVSFFSKTNGKNIQVFQKSLSEPL